ncbi:thiaminase II/PqqC family protein [Streptomyces lancefieldiae]|uniref:Thiaminase-2/PQQC domain-containing protein n=1 Tax=Streptomyces lancefieldiae TaxID=3075520 RepID=A0ABU3ARD6_9ACTN|nr:hypothetical protein [Streptomyces sp. DSM 40712]MDT0612762.1 hypothetical protein [Streptomyces sp. DSM 40712]
MNAVDRLIAEARRQMAGPTPNRFLDLLEAGRISQGHLAALAGELYRLVSSDRRSFALAAVRFPDPTGDDLFLALAQGESEALRLLLGFAAGLGLDEERLRAYESEPLAQAYPAFLAQTAAFGSRSDLALALLANVAESGATYARAADALQSAYGLGDGSVAHFRYFAETPREVLDQAAATLESGLAGGDAPAAAVRTARMVHRYEKLFWSTLAEIASEGVRPG